ncbi:unnamed protein product [Larinioides sclopetarius]|uniref:SMB domain-containing protein n=1 Tax=Larinioides sclopetarius TaxID=280406 RepID=A0AAV1Z9B8_9ARAC
MKLFSAEFRFESKMSSKYLLVFCIIKCIICLSSVYGQQGFQYEPYYPQQPYPPYQPYNEVEDDLRGDYCNRRGPLKCCPQRDDTCSVPILGTLCYCDLFCNRTISGDCCPDFEEVCLGRRVQPPEQIVRPHRFPCLKPTDPAPLKWTITGYMRGTGHQEVIHPLLDPGSIFIPSQVAERTRHQ